MFLLCNACYSCKHKFKLMIALALNFFLQRIEPEHGVQRTVLTEGDEDEATPAQQKHCGCLRFTGFK